MGAFCSTPVLEKTFVGMYLPQALRELSNKKVNIVALKDDDVYKHSPMKGVTIVYNATTNIVIEFYA